MPGDWLFAIESIIIRLVPAYTLETLDRCDIERILPFYFYDYRMKMKSKVTAEEEPINNDIKTVNGKKYRVISAVEAAKRFF